MYLKPNRPHEISTRRLILLNWFFMVIQGLAWLLIPLLLVEEGEVFLAAASWALLLLPYAFGALPAGHFGDSHNRLSVLLFAVSLTLAAALLLTLAIQETERSSLLILIASALFGLARPFADAAIIGELSQRGDALRRNTKMSRAIAAEPGGRVLGAALLWLALFVGGFMTASLILVMLSALLFLPLLLSVRSFARKKGQAEIKPQSWRAKFLEILRQPDLKSVVLLGVLWNLFMAGIIGGLAPAFIKELLEGISADEIALLLLAASIIAVGGSLLSPSITQSLGAKRTLWIFTALATGLLLVTSSLEGAVASPYLILALLLFYFSNQVFVTNLIVQRQLLAPTQSSSTVATLTRMITWVALAVGTLSYGLALSSWSAATLLYVMASLSGALLVAYLFVWRGDWKRSTEET